MHPPAPSVRMTLVVRMVPRVMTNRLQSVECKLHTHLDIVHTRSQDRNDANMVGRPYQEEETPWSSSGWFLLLALLPDPHRYLPLLQGSKTVAAVTFAMHPGYRTIHFGIREMIVHSPIPLLFRYRHSQSQYYYYYYYEAPIGGVVNFASPYGSIASRPLLHHRYYYHQYHPPQSVHQYFLCDHS